MKKYLKYLPKILMGLFAALFLVSAGILIDYFIDSGKQKDQYNDLANLVQQEIDNASGDTGTDSSGTPLSEYVTVTIPETGDTVEVLREYAKVFEMNTDMAGWIRISGTSINYPVMQTPGRPNYYLKRDFYEVDSRHGCIYAGESANLDAPSDNVIIYGHRMADGTMFAPLHNYQSKSFYDQNSLIQFDTLTERHTYQICYVFFTTANQPDSFNYHTFVDGTGVEFMDFVTMCKELSLYDTGVEVSYGDKLITLSTCDHSVDEGRLVVVAKRIY